MIILILKALKINALAVYTAKAHRVFGISQKNYIYLFLTESQALKYCFLQYYR